MSSVPADKIPNPELQQLAISYASFILAGTGAQTTVDSLNSVLKASGVKVDDALVQTFAKTLKTKKVTDMFGSVGGGSAGPSAALAAPVKEEKKKEEKKEDKKAPPPPPPAEEEGMDMGGLFD